MAVQSDVKSGTRIHGVHFVLTDYVSAALTAGTKKRQWVMPCKGRLTNIKVYSGVAGTGAGNVVIDINRNGTSIFAAAGDKPTLVNTDSGFYQWDRNSGMQPEFDEGDIVSYDVDSVGATAGPTETSIALSFGVLN